MPQNILRFSLLFVLIAAGLFAKSSVADDQYEVVQSRPSLRGHFWLSDGPSDVASANQSVGNRFRLGGELQFGSFSETAGTVTYPGANVWTLALVLGFDTGSRWR
jgi:hypothetical protein